HDQVVIIPTILESSDHLSVAGKRRENAQLELGIVDVNENATIRSTEENAEFRIGRNVLQIRIGTSVTPGNCPTSMQLTMQPPVEDRTGQRGHERRKARQVLRPRIECLDQSPLGRLQTIGNKNRGEVFTAE